MSSPPVEGTEVCALSSHPRQVAQTTSGSGKGAVRQLGQHFPWSRMSLHTLTAQRCPIPGDLGGCSCNRNNAPHRLGGFQPSLSHIALMQSDKYIPLYPAPLTLRLISKPDSAQLLGSQCHMQHHPQAQQQGWAHGKGAGPSPAASSFHPVPQEATLQETGAQPSTKSSHNQVTPGNTRPLQQRRLGQLDTVTKNSDGSERCHSETDHHAEETQPVPKSLLLVCVPVSLPAPGIWAGDTWLSQS